jgi:hypothetical protein
LSDAKSVQPMLTVGFAPFVTGTPSRSSELLLQVECQGWHRGTRFLTVLPVDALPIHSLTTAGLPILPERRIAVPQRLNQSEDEF